MKPMRSLDTSYDGHLFRSRLEARWAVFFNTLGVVYSYEHDGYDLGDGVNYLPDFWLPELDLWIEVKGKKPLPRERDKAQRLAVQSGQDVAIVWGPIPSPLKPCRDDTVDVYEARSGLLMKGLRMGLDDDGRLTFVRQNVGWLKLADALAAARRARFGW